MPMPQMMPGGQLISGFGGSVLVNENGLSQQVALTVGLWWLLLTYENVDVTHSGCRMARTRRRVVYDYRFACELPLDKQLPPHLYLQAEAGVGLQFLLGDPTDYASGLAQSYRSPSALLSQARTILNARGTDVVRMDLAGEGNSRIFHLPFEQKAYEKYMDYLQDQGWLY